MMGTSTCSKLSHKLLDSGFFSALGTLQVRCVGMTQRDEELRVQRGTPNTWDFNNGVIAVYDESGCPWISVRNTHTNGEVNKLARSYGLQRGAYVPHSNDGGHFVRRIIPDL